MMELNRRAFGLGALAALAAPAIIRKPGLLMPVKKTILLPTVKEYKLLLNESIWTYIVWRDQSDILRIEKVAS